MTFLLKSVILLGKKAHGRLDENKIEAIFPLATGVVSRYTEIHVSSAHKT